MTAKALSDKVASLNDAAFRGASSSTTAADNLMKEWDREDSSREQGQEEESRKRGVRKAGWGQHQ